MDRSRKRSPAWRLYFIVVSVAILHVLRFGYDFGSSDQDELVPAVLHALDPKVLSADWFVTSQALQFNVREPTVAVLSGVARIIGVPAATLLLYALSFVLLSLAIVRITSKLTSEPVAVLIAPLLLLVFTPRFTLGGNDLTHSLFVPSMLAWAFALHGLACFMTRSGVKAGLLFGLSIWIQPLVGILVSFATCAGFAAGGIQTRNVTSVVARAGVAGAVAIVVGLPVLIPMVQSQVHPGTPTDKAMLFEILVNFRAPHHYLPSAFPRESFVRFGVLLAAGLASTVLSPAGRTFRREFLGVLGVVTVCCVGYVVAVGVFESLTVAKLQLFKLTVLAKVLAGSAVAASLGETIGGLHSGRKIRRIIDHPAASLGVTGVAVVIVVLGAITSTLDGRLHILARRGSAATQMHSWIRTNTPADAIFAVPPSDSEMRSRARRAIVVNFKAFAFQDELMLEWYRRMDDITGNLASDHATSMQTGSSVSDLDAAYELLDPLTLNELRHAYGFSYVLRHTPLEGAGVDHAVWHERARFGDPTSDDGGFVVYEFAPSQQATPNAP